MRGYGDRSEYVLKLNPISLIPGAANEATHWLEEHGDDKTSDRISAVAELLTGFASAYGVELLATAHWTSTREAGGSTDPAALTEIIGNWNERKGRLFTEAHVGKAVGRLEELGWIGK